MRVPRPYASALLTLPLALCLLTPFSHAADLSDSSTAQRALGPEWKRLSRRAGMIFAGTVLRAEQPVRCGNKPNSSDEACPVSRVAAIPSSSFAELRFRIDLPIAGVEAGKILTIHEWAGAQDRHRPLRPGDRVLLFLYPPSRLGLTSPVGGLQGQIRLDSTGQQIQQHSPLSPITLTQLARAIRAARGD
ncbi:MAG TPA: hypothetical protein VMI10_08100 [Terriglobales bacterium]|nr:hypothetical protein [Terriglobales bacterium]